jgi:RNA polymerase sigma-70 factor, ECF subfamily
MRLRFGKAKEEQPREVASVERELLADPGSERAFLSIYKRIHDEAMDHARMYLDEAAAWDAVQEGFGAVWKRWEYLTIEQRSRGYFFRSVHNAVLKRLRKDKRFVELERAEEELTRLAIESIDQSADDESGEVDLPALVERIMAELPPRRREVYLLARERRLSHAEVAEALGLSPATVNRHLTLANEIVVAKLRRAGFRIGSPAARKSLPPVSREASND